MKIAKEYFYGDFEVDLYAIQYHDENRIQLPECFIRTKDLTRSILDIRSFSEKKKLALIGDILDELYHSAPNAEYFIYTNVDIALQPYFYKVVSLYIEQGLDSFVINRRTVSDRFKSPEEIPLMYAEIGDPHNGYDCFVFKRDLYPKFKLRSICIGTAWIGRALLANLVSYSTRFKEFRNEHLTFHIGDPRPWKREEFSDYFKHNQEEYLSIFKELEEENRICDSLWRSYLLDTGAKREIPSFS